jgi:hypothetical protein
MLTIEKSFQRFMLNGFPKIQGWCEPSVPYMTEKLAHFQNQNSISGSVMEIGVHHGKLFLVLNALTQDNERSLAIDVFEDQDLNIDHSGRGDKSMLDSNIEQFSDRKEFIDKLKADSSALSDEDVANLQRQYGKFKIISIDGGHTPEHTIRDFNIAQNLIANGGIVIIDDINNISWPGVYEGVARIFFSDRPRVVPFLLGCNKLYLTTIGYHKRLFDYTLSCIKTDQSQKIAGTTKRVKMFGHDVVSWKPSRV